jgi:hypothetical protein
MGVDIVGGKDEAPVELPGIPAQNGSESRAVRRFIFQYLLLPL